MTQRYRLASETWRRILRWRKQIFIVVFVDRACTWNARSRPKLALPGWNPPPERPGEKWAPPPCVGPELCVDRASEKEKRRFPPKTHPLKSMMGLWRHVCEAGPWLCIRVRFLRSSFKTSFLHFLFFSIWKKKKNYFPVVTGFTFCF